MIRARPLSACGALLLILGFASSAVRAADIAVDLSLVIAVDVSSSMTREEQAVQRAGYVAAIQDPAVIRAILSGSRARIAIAYLEWADPGYQVVVVPWRLVDSAVAARRFAAELDTKPVMRATQTSISAALRYAATLFANSGFRASRRVIDISGDGPNNTGPPVTRARDAVVAQGIVINGLPVMLQPSQTGYAARPDLADYYRDCVIGGPGAFVRVANLKRDIAIAIRLKLVREIAGRPPRPVRAADRKPATKADCMIGQKDFHE